MKGVVFDIQRYSLQDGPGIRTTVFLKGCPLRCRWCSNPESQNPQPEIMFRARQCQSCGTCADVCEVGAVTLIDGVVNLDRDRCTMCLDCVEVCPSGAMQVSGKSMDLEEVVEEACKDELFYTNSGGGVTLSGGEPLAQPEFSILFLKACKDRAIHTVLDTSGLAAWEVMGEVLEHTDLVLFDLKHLSRERHLQGTQASNNLILANLRRTLDSNRTRVWIRIPVVPGYNDADSYLTELAGIVGEMGAEKVSLLGYHEWGRPKYEALGRAYPCEKLEALSKARLESMKNLLAARGIEVTIDH